MTHPTAQPSIQLYHRNSPTSCTHPTPHPLRLAPRICDYHAPLRPDWYKDFSQNHHQDWHPQYVSLLPSSTHHVHTWLCRLPQEQHHPEVANHTAVNNRITEGGKPTAKAYRRKVAGLPLAWRQTRILHIFFSCVVESTAASQSGTAALLLQAKVAGSSQDCWEDNQDTPALTAEHPHHQKVHTRAASIPKGPKHGLLPLLPLGRRYRYVNYKTTIFKNYFCTFAMRLLNS